MRRGLFVCLVALAAVSLEVAPAGAIVNGQLDGNLHPSTGALVAEYVQPGQKDVLCVRAR